MTEPLKRCGKCGQWKPEGDFRWLNRGGRSNFYQRGYCVSCATAQVAGLTSLEQVECNGRRWRRRARHKHLVCAIRGRCRKKGIAFDLDDHIDKIGKRIYNGVCEMTGLPFDFEQEGKPKWNSPSIDRKDPEGGYLYSNIRVVCHGMNAAMGQWGEDVLMAMIAARIEYRSLI